MFRKMHRNMQLGYGESASSYVSRLAPRYGALSAFDFCRDMGTSFRDVFDGTDTVLDPLAQGLVLMRTSSVCIPSDVPHEIRLFSKVSNCHLQL